MRTKILLFSAIAILALAGCESNPKKSTGELMRDISLSNNDVVKAQIQLRIEEQKTRQKEIDVELATSTYINAIALNGGQTEKVNGQTALLALARGRGGSASGSAPSVPNIPPQQAIPAERDWLDRTLQIANIVIPGGAPAILSPILAARTAGKQIDAATEQARIAGETTRAQWTAVAGMNHDAIAGMQGLGLAGFTTIGDVVSGLGRPNINTWNVTGDYAGGNLAGRFSGNTGQILNGGGILNTGANNRFTSPGPYIQPSCVTGATSGDAPVNCPVNQ